MKQAQAACVLAMVLFLAACTGHTPVGATGADKPPDSGGSKTPISANCTCDEFPFPQACKSTCEVAETTIESVNLKEQTATVTIHRGANMERKTIALSALPPGQPVERGARFTTLFKKDVAAPSNPRIVRFTRVVK